MIVTTYDPEADALYVYLMPRGTPVAETIEVADGAMHDLDAEGRLIGIEVLHVRARGRCRRCRGRPEPRADDDFDEMP